VKQKENKKINILNNEQIQLNNLADTINKQLAPVFRFITLKSNVLFIICRKY